MIRPAVARIASPARGTAFAISASTALTACHNLFERPDDDSPPVTAVDLHFPTSETRRAEVLDFDIAEDWAVLGLAEPLPLTLRPLRLHRHMVYPGEQCRCLGFPRVAEEYGMLPLLVMVSGETERDNGAPVLTLEAATVAGGLNPSGLSGGPVVRLHERDE